MNIQISVIIWTVICFVTLVLILRNLLFKPILEVMDKRQRRIELAAQKREEEKRLLEEIEQKQILQKAAFEEEQQEKIQSEIEKIHADSKKAVEDARIARLEEVEQYRKKAEQEHDGIVSELESSTKVIAEAFVKKLIS